MLNECLIFIGSGLGGLTRFSVSNLIYSLLGRQFPYGTLVVNISGSFLMGLLFFILLQKFGELGPSLRSLLLIGFLGGYTTFSAFSIETYTLMEKGAWIVALINIVLSISLCLMAVYMGAMMGKR